MATFTVTSLSDVTDATDGVLTLREAAELANTTAGADTIDFDTGAGGAIEGGGLLRLIGGQIQIADDLIVNGSGTIMITGYRSGNDVLVPETFLTDMSVGQGSLLADNTTLFGSIDASTDMTLIGLTLTGGYARGGRDGGAVRSEGGLTLLDMTISGNGTSGTGGDGGGVYSIGHVEVIDSRVSGNDADRGSGGGIFASSGVYALRSEISDNVSRLGLGGGIFSNGDTKIISSSVIRNQTQNDAGKGGGIYVGFNTQNTVTNSTIAHNKTNGSHADGAGIFHRSRLDLFNSTITGNSTVGANAEGAGVYTFVNALMLVHNSIISGNTTNHDGLGDDEISGAYAKFGGNILGDTVFDQRTAVRTTSADETFSETERVVLGTGATTLVRAGTLRDNGGPTETIALKLGGTAVGLANLAFFPVDTGDIDSDGDTTELILSDGRGAPRSESPAPDLGAYEILLSTGTDGDDVFIGTEFAEVFDGTGGIDEIRYVNSAAGVRVDLDAVGIGGDATADSLFSIENITGSSFADLLIGNDAANVLLGLAGADRLRGGAGNDILEGGADNDILEGGTGANRFVFGADNGDDQIIGWEASTDVLDFDALGLRFADLRLTSSGNEALITFDDHTGGTGSVRLIDIDPEVLEIGIVADLGGVGSGLGSPGGIPLLAGTSGSENFAGSAAGEDLIGLAGNDTLNGRAGDDTMLGGFGNDRYLLDDAGDIALEFEFQGIDQVDTRFSLTLADNIERGAVRGGGAVDITGNALDNFITGSELTNVLGGGNGRDRLIARGGNDTLDGGLDNDVLEGGSGGDVFVFGADSEIDLITDFVVGEDLIDVTALGIAFADMTIVDGPLGALVIFDLEPGSVDLVQLQGVSAADVRQASFIGAPNLPIIGTEGNDVLRGTVEDDELLGLGGEDRLDGLGGADTLIGGPGDDRYFVDDAGDVVIEFAGEGTDLVTTLIDFTLPDNVEDLNTQTDLAVNLTGNGLANLLNGNDATNVLNGLDGDDNLLGKGGADTIDGGIGFDVLRGGADADVFVFALGDGATGDQLIDFEVGVDTIDLSATGLAFGDLTITDVGANASVTYGMNTLTVFNTTAAQLDQDQFEF